MPSSSSGGSASSTGGAGGGAVTTSVVGGGGAGVGGASSCEADELTHGLTGHCYVQVQSSLTWDDAREACLALGMGYDLAAVTAPEELDFLQNALDTAEPTFIGGHDMNVENSWEWINGESWGYEAWHPNEPNDAGKQGQDCVAVQYDLATGQIWGFDDKGCFISTWYLCERSP